jgi:DNA end-binding protein Ku
VTKLLNAMLAAKAMYVPVGVCTATKRKDLEFKTLHHKCLAPISTAKQCPTCQADNLQADELVKGFEFSKKQYIAVDTEMLEGLSAGRSKVIDIKKFVPWDAIDELQVEKSYYLQPESMLVRPYALLANAMSDKEAVGVGTTSLWGKEYPSMVWARENGVIVLSLLFCHDEIVDSTSISEGAEVPVPDDEQELMNMLVAVMTDELNPHEDLVSHARVRANEYLVSLVEGTEFEGEKFAEAPDATMDVMESIKKSLAMARK